MLPIKSLFRSSIAKFRSAVAADLTTLSASNASNSTKTGRHFSLRTAALISADSFTYNFKILMFKLKTSKNHVLKGTLHNFLY